MAITSNAEIGTLQQAVQHNCHISDALYARNYSLCIYLLKMREFYRWEMGFSFRDPLPKEPLGEWLTGRERLWEELEEAPFRPLAVAASEHTPFDAEAINPVLAAHGLVYSGGYCGAKPHFFLAELEKRVEEEGASVYVAGRELAREITAPPAMSLGDTIFLRRESLSRMIWEKLEEWGWQDPNRAIARAVAHYGFERDFDLALERMTGDELDTLLEHELGEVMIGRELGPDWEAMLSALPRSRAEYQLRAIRDHLVDCRRTLPWLLESGRDAALHFYMANFTTLRKEIFPALVTAYDKWLQGDGGKALREAVKRGAEHWQAQAEKALSLYRGYEGEDSKALLRALAALDEGVKL
ncbi:MAG: Sfum_1244 family protein [Pseudomonadota bacterium]